jgi:hypothetical protein
VAITYRYVDWPGGTFDTSLVDRVRLGSLEGFVQAAEHASAPASGLAIDDDAGSTEIKGLKLLIVEDDEAPAGNRIVYVGLIGSRNLKEANSLNQGAAREIDATITDVNALLALRYITGTDGKRPRETAKARLEWLLSSDYMSGITDQGLVVYPSHYLSANDYRGQSPVDVLADCALPINFDFWGRWNEAAAGPELFFDNMDRSQAWASELRLSNVLADVDSDLFDGIGATKTFGMAMASTLTRDPIRVASGAYGPFARGAEYVTDDDIAAEFIRRDLTAPNANAKTRAEMRKILLRFLKDNDTEADSIEVAVELPSENVNDIQAGHLIEAKFRHLTPEGFSDFSWFRVRKRTVSQTKKTDAFWRVGLTLTPANPFACEDAEDINQDHGTILGAVQLYAGDVKWAHATISDWFGGPLDTEVSTIPVSNPAFANDGDVATYSNCNQYVLRGLGTVDLVWIAEFDGTYELCSTSGTVQAGNNSWRSRAPDVIEYWDGAAYKAAAGGFTYGPVLPSPQYWTYTFATPPETTKLKIIYRFPNLPLGPFGLWNWNILGTRLYDWIIRGAAV